MLQLNQLQILLLGLAFGVLVSCEEGVLDPEEVLEGLDSADSQGAQEASVLEDPASWGASSEELGRNHSNNRRRRSVDLEAAESVLFMPAFLKQKKKTALAECRGGHDEMRLWKRNNPERAHHRHVQRCNGYCCYPLVS